MRSEQNIHFWQLPSHSDEKATYVNEATTSGFRAKKRIVKRDLWELGVESHVGSKKATKPSVKPENTSNIQIHSSHEDNCL